MLTTRRQTQANFIIPLIVWEALNVIFSWKLSKSKIYMIKIFVLQRVKSKKKKTKYKVKSKGNQMLEQVER